LAEYGNFDFDITQYNVMENRSKLLDINTGRFDCEKNASIG